MNIVNKEIIVKGLVQGVYFRATTKSVADKMGVFGIVKNMPDGNVFIVAEGVPHVVEQFVAWCRIGPTKAKVAELEIKNGEIRHYTNFEIDY
ncbi:acylphosphatase [Chitinophaga skermanii]|uniref:acylphosphatase n=1 Tax=Chitinophaga skermanii TaxID=331697 RepID=A0A327QD96_9BACT|nr:acylphosphatase [Chitinophaga skermanii]RAJ02450.1 acylphosphatase [Chitinophaga skermanii]